MIYQALTGDLLFGAAFEVWMAHRSLEARPGNGVRYISAKTDRDYRVGAKALGKYFGRLRLNEIDAGRMAVYQQLRAENPVDTVNGTWRCRRRGWPLRHEFPTLEAAEGWAREHGGGCEYLQTVWAYPASAGCIRKEIALLERMLKDAGLWTEEQGKKFLKVRAEEPDIARALSREEQHRLLHVASAAARHQFIHQYIVVALQTTAGPNELRQLKLGDIFLEEREPFIQIPRAGAKNKYRQRTIPLITAEAVWAMEGLLGRARRLGAWSAAHYLFPFQTTRTHYDPGRPMSESGMKKAWDALRREALMPALRIYDLRHTGITRMAEAGVPLPVAMSFAGHMTEQMQRHYTSISMAAQRQWGAAVWGPGAMGEAGFEGPPKKPVLAEHGMAALAAAGR